MTDRPTTTDAAPPPEIRPGRTTAAAPRPRSSGLSRATADADAASREAIPESLLRRITRYSGRLSTDAVRAIEADLPFFAGLSADQRSEIQLIIQSAVRDFVSWIRNPDASLSATIEGFKLLPQETGEGLSLQQTVQVVSATSEYFELVLPRVGHNEVQRSLMVAAVLKFGRELGFTAAAVYAAAAEDRGAWDTRMEALIVDAVVRGDAAADLASGASALNWDLEAPATVIVGRPREELGVAAVTAAHTAAAGAGRSVLAVVQGARLVLVLSGPLDSLADIPDALLEAFADDPVVVGGTARSLVEAPASATAAIGGAAAVAGWPDAPRPVAADDLLPERVLAGEARAREVVLTKVFAPLCEADESISRTLETYFDSGGHVEACARALFVHPNTVRYRLRRVATLTGYDPTDARDAFVLRIAVAIGRIKPQEPQ